ncbi:MAG: hypothetical protein GYB66_13800 [Chloroflexi bacterium]|nr:hypothetical protein [Chloroflexota bacterium]
MTQGHYRLSWAGLALFLLLAGVYWLSFLGVNINNDEVYLFDSTESLVRRGDFRLNYTYHLYPQIRVVDGQLLERALQEPLQPILAAPLFMVGQFAPSSIGVMHSVWLFNIIVTALTGVIMYRIALRRRFHSEVAWTTGMIFGLATLAWPFSRYFFREPLASLLILACIGLAWELRACWYSARVASAWLIVLLGVFAVTVLAKSAMLVFIPALVLMAVPSLTSFLRDWRVVLSVGLFSGLMLLGTLLIGDWLNNPRFQVAFWQNAFAELNWTYVMESLAGYHISPGRSMWLFSPVLVLALPGAVKWWRSGEWQLVVASGLMFILIPMAYGAGRDHQWWGGSTGWGPRQMLPLVPLAILLTLPVIEHGFKRTTPLTAKLAILTLILLSTGLQMLGVSVSLRIYHDNLSDEGIKFWEEGIWTWGPSPISRYIQMFDPDQVDIAWAYSENTVWPVILLTLTVVVLSALWGYGLLISRYPPRRLNSIFGLGLGLIYLVCLGVGLNSLRDDPRYLRQPDVLLLINAMEEAVSEDDAVILYDQGLQSAFMNYFKVPAFLASLPYSPGENYRPGIDPPEWEDAPPETLLGTGSTVMLDWAAERYSRIWLVVNTSPAIATELRPTERYMAQNYYPIDEIQVSDVARAVQFYARPVPDGTPAVQQNIQFGDHLTLAGFDLPEGEVYNPGEVVPVSLVWETLQSLETSYNVSIRVAESGRPPVAQRDGLPQGTFGDTALWHPGEQYRDNHGLVLPDDLPPGEYHLQVIIYEWPELQRLPVTPGDGDIAVLATLFVTDTSDESD